MRYARFKTLCTLLLTATFALPMFAQSSNDGKPALLTAEQSRQSTWGGERDPRIPQADNDGTVQGSSLTQRMNSIRRRAVDASISRPFLTEGTGDSFQTDADTLKGSLPAVKRRPLGPMPTPVLPSESTRRAVPENTTQPQIAPIQPLPDTVKSQLPTPAMELATPLPAESLPPAALPSIPTTDIPTTEIPLGGIKAPETRTPTIPVATTPEPTIEVASQNLADEPEVEEEPLEPLVVDANSTNLLVTNDAPAITFKTSGPRKIIIGREASYEVTMINQSSVAASGVICSVTLPPWAEIIGSTASVGAPQVESDANQNNVIRWEIPALAAKGSEKLALNLVPRDGRAFDLAVGWTFAQDRAMAMIEVQEPKLELSLNGSEEVDYGDTQTYTISISNPGTGDAENVVLSLLPSTNQQPIAGTRNIGTIAAGERKTIELELTAHQAGRLQVRAMAHADNGLRAEASQEVLVRRANLDVVIMGPPRNYAANTATYKVRVENTGDAMAEDAMATASLPAGAKYIKSTDGGKYDPKRAQVAWRIGSLRPGSIRVLEMECELHSAGENRLDVQCQASQELSVAKSVVTVVEALADLKLYVDDPPGAIPTGSEAIYEVRVVNRGTKAAENIELVAYFSDGVEPEMVEGGRGQVATGQVAFDPIPSIAAGQEISFRIKARANAPGNHVFRAELQCRAPETRLATEDWTKYYQRNSGQAPVQQASNGIQLR